MMRGAATWIRRVQNATPNPRARSQEAKTPKVTGGSPGGRRGGSGVAGEVSDAADVGRVLARLIDHIVDVAGERPHVGRDGGGVEHDIGPGRRRERHQASEGRGNCEGEESHQ